MAVLTREVDDLAAGQECVAELREKPLGANKELRHLDEVSIRKEVERVRA